MSYVNIYFSKYIIDIIIYYFYCLPKFIAEGSQSTVLV